MDEPMLVLDQTHAVFVLTNGHKRQRLGICEREREKEREKKREKERKREREKERKRERERESVR